MTTSVNIAIDVMGSDKGPATIIAASSLSKTRYPAIKYTYLGNSKLISKYVEKYKNLINSFQIIHTDEQVLPEEKPSLALRKRKNSSMGRALSFLKEKNVDAVVSAGNTGALMAMAKFVLKTLPGIDRPAIASYFPTERGQSLMLDLGANVICSSDNLVQFAVMGEVFARNVLGLPQPSVGILNVGSEQLKGHESVQLAFYALQNIDLPIKFHGFIEGDDIGKGTVDVIVTDGFTGNIALKTAEGTAKKGGPSHSTTRQDGLRPDRLAGREGALKLTKKLNVRRSSVRRVPRRRPRPRPANVSNVSNRDARSTM